MYSYKIILLVILASCACVVVANTPAPRCFQFTWLGPKYNNESIFMNATCQDATRLSNGIPCQHPLVVSEDGSWPDVQHIWRMYRRGASCELANNDVCAQYTYFFNGIVENSTYMCTRAIDTNGLAINSGCFEQRNGSFATRVCFCKSIGGAIPCNTAGFSSILSTSAFLIALAVSLRGIDTGTKF